MRTLLVHSIPHTLFCLYFIHISLFLFISHLSSLFSPFAFHIYLFIFVSSLSLFL
ncbi:hypothetical protein J3Q64DRAFT_1740552 [Phycomyces blakesleeanus]|uniref:Uncharacterized protein n=1 Tax=Phycomyces blakesleeanus TaxID=4837 RepID=A0ABR3B0Z6_PHYBL